MSSSIYYSEPKTDLYGLSKKQLINPILYLLSKVQTQNNQKDIKSYSKDVSSSDNELYKIVKSKYNLFKQNEPQSIGSGRKRFTFNRKK